jgi:hypothetical protein
MWFRRARTRAWKQSYSLHSLLINLDLVQIYIKFESKLKRTGGSISFLKFIFLRIEPKFTFCPRTRSILSASSDVWGGADEEKTRDKRDLESIWI